LADTFLDLADPFLDFFNFSPHFVFPALSHTEANQKRSFMLNWRHNSWLSTMAAKISGSFLEEKKMKKHFFTF
jgi:hypothetical protein